MHALTPTGPLTDPRQAYPVPAGRFVRVNFAASVDGAVTVDGTSRGVSGEADRALFHLLRDVSDAVLVGAGTVRAEGYGGARPGVTGVPPPLVVVSRSLRLDPAARLFTDTQVRPIVLTCEAAPAESRAALADLADVIVAGDDEVDLPAAIQALAARGLTRLLCEGGPQLFASMLAAGLVDELCLTLAPLLAGSAGSHLLPAGVAGQRLRLLHVLEDDGYLFLRYSTAR